MDKIPLGSPRRLARQQAVLEVLETFRPTPKTLTDLAIFAGLTPSQAECTLMDLEQAGRLRFAIKKSGRLSVQILPATPEEIEIGGVM